MRIVHPISICWAPCQCAMVIEHPGTDHWPGTVRSSQRINNSNLELKAFLLMGCFLWDSFFLNTSDHYESRQQCLLKLHSTKSVRFYSSSWRPLSKLSKEVCTPHVQWTSPTPAIFCSSEEHWSGRLETWVLLLALLLTCCVTLGEILLSLSFRYSHLQNKEVVQMEF